MAANKELKDTVSETQGTVAPDAVVTEKPDDMVEIMLFEDGDKYKDDVFVAVNGKTFQIKRGEPVKVPRYVKEVLDNAAKQNKAANTYMNQKQNAYEKDAQKFDI